MQYLLLAIAAMSLIMLALKFFNVKKIYIPQAIMTNYAFAPSSSPSSPADGISRQRTRAVSAETAGGTWP